MPADALRNEVPYPPPPARVEVVPPRKNDAEVWVDGQWQWTASTWKWVAGTWVTPPKGVYFTPWSMIREPGGRLQFIAASWRDKSGRTVDIGWGDRVCPVPPAVPTSTQVAKAP